MVYSVKNKKKEDTAQHSYIKYEERGLYLVLILLMYMYLTTLACVLMLSRDKRNAMGYLISRLWKLNIREFKFYMK